MCRNVIQTVSLKVTKYAKACDNNAVIIYKIYCFVK